MNTIDKDSDNNDFSVVHTEETLAFVKPETTATEPEEKTGPAFFTVSENKLLNMYVLSFGLYGIYWFYQNWKLQQRFMDKKIYPVWRSLFAIIFIYPLFRRIQAHAGDIARQEGFNPGFLASLYIATFVLDTLADMINTNTTLLQGVSNAMLTVFSLAMFFISAYPLMKAQAVINRINGDILGFQNNSYSLSSYLVIAFGLFVWMMFALGFLAESLGFMNGEYYEY